MAFQTAKSITPALWLTLKDVPGGPLAFLDGLWGRLVGAPLCYKTSPAELNGKTLLISVSTLPWQRTLEKMSDLLVRRINGICGCTCVEQVCFQVAPITRAAQLSARKPHVLADTMPGSASGRKSSGQELAHAEIEEAIRSMVSRYL